MTEPLTTPFWVVGAPRSGTTFFGRVLDAHPRVFCTEETRVLTFVNRIINGLAGDTWILMHHRREFLDLLREQVPGLVEEYYRRLGATPGQRWGDKHPHYADAHHDPELLDLIDELFPDSQFIHIIRDGRAVVSSNVAKGWGSVDYACDSWRRHVVHARDLGTRHGPDRYLELRYEALLERPHEVVAAVFAFLGVGPSTEVAALLDAQETARTAWSAPTEGTTIGVDAWRSRYDDETLDRVERNLADLLVELSYEQPSWRRDLLSRPPRSTEPPPSWTVAGHARNWADDLPPPMGTGRP